MSNFKAKKYSIFTGNNQVIVSGPLDWGDLSGTCTSRAYGTMIVDAKLEYLESEEYYDGEHSLSFFSEDEAKEISAYLSFDTDKYFTHSISDRNCILYCTIKNHIYYMTKMNSFRENINISPFKEYAIRIRERDISKCIKKIQNRSIWGFSDKKIKNLNLSFDVEKLYDI